MIVMKFGGTSLQDGEAIERAIQAIWKQLDQQPLVVLSALGKTTDQLLKIAKKAASGQVRVAMRVQEELREYHCSTARDILSGSHVAKTKKRLDQFFSELSNITQGFHLQGECSARSLDTIISLGERMSTWIFSQALLERGCRAVLLDARELILTNDRFNQAAVLEDISLRQIREGISPLLKKGFIAVLQGFIGSTKDGAVTTIGRGGSDYTASLAGAALNAKEIQIWTDVPGILTTDPLIVPEAFKIKALSFAEASELAYFGARVLHPKTLLPAMVRNIPVRVCNSLWINHTGTRISSQPSCPQTAVKAIACKKGITVVNVHSPRMLLAYGFLRRIFEVFERYETVVDVVATSEVSVSLTIDSSEKLDPIVADLKAFGQVDVEHDTAIICIVGDNLKYTPGIAARVFRGLGSINVHMISQGASRINLTFLVQQSKMKMAVRKLHHEFFRDPDPALFEPC